ncbi:MAG: Gfo/Idh/MocA family protein [Anaerolineae bacterium]
MAYRAAIIGCGRMAHGHAHAYKEAGIPLVAGADISAQSLEKWKTDFGDDQKLYTDMHQMLAETKPDLVSVVTPEQAHCAAVVAAAEAGAKGIVCEKPLAMNLAETDRMIETCKRTGTVLTVSHQRHYTPQYEIARQRIEAGNIGKVLSCMAISQYMCLMTDACHTIHMMMDLMGWPKPTHLIGNVDGNSDYVYFGHRAEEGGTAYIGFEGGLFSHFTWGRCARNPDVRMFSAWDNALMNYQYIVVQGETGQIQVSGDYYRGMAPLGDRWLVREVHGADAVVVPVPLSERGDITREVDDVVAAIETGKPHPLDAMTRGKTIMEIMIGMYESSRRRGVVHFPVTVQDNPFLSMVDSGVFPK